MRKLILLLVLGVFLALPAHVRADRWAKGVGPSYLAAGLNTDGGIQRDASINWLKYSSENFDTGSSFGTYEMAVMAGAPSVTAGAREYTYPDPYPAQPLRGGTRGKYPDATSSTTGIYENGFHSLVPAIKAETRSGGLIRLWKQQPTTIMVDGRNNTVRKYSARPSTEDQVLFADDGDKVVADIWGDAQPFARAMSSTSAGGWGGGLYPGTELTAWMYGSGTEGYTDHLIVTQEWWNTGRVPLSKGEAGYYAPGQGGAGTIHGASKIAGNAADLKGFVLGWDQVGFLSPYDVAAKEQSGSGIYTGGPRLGDRGDRLTIYDDVNKIVFSIDGEDVTQPQKPNRGDPVWMLGSAWSLWNQTLERKITPGEFLDVATGALFPLHLDKVAVKDSAIPTLANPTLAAAANLAANWITDPASIGTDAEQPMRVVIGGTQAGEPYDWKVGEGLGPGRASKIEKVFDWLERPANKGAWDFANKKWKDGLDPATLDYDKTHIGYADPSNYGLLTFGPIDVPMGSRVHFAFGLAAGGTDRALNQLMGQFYGKKKWLTRNELDTFQDLYDDWDYIQGFPFWKARLAAKAGSPFTESDKHQWINSVFDSLYASVGVAKQVYADGIAAGRFGPKYPTFIGWPASVTYSKQPGKISLSWTAAPGAAKYRVYRTVKDYGKQRRRIAEVTGTSYDDTAVLRGNDYFYSIVAVDAQGREGSQMMALATYPTIPLRAPATGWLSKVVVVPNPYNRNGGAETAGGFNWSGNTQAQTSVKFINLPPKATINIFTTTGDLVTTVFHTDGTGEEPWFLLTDNLQRPVSGLYLCHIRNDDNPSETKMLKLVVAR